MERRLTTLRDAAPTLDDGLVFARYLDVAAEGFFGFLLGRRATEIIARAFIQPGHDLSHQHAVFAECEGHVVGMVSGYTAEQHQRADGEVLARAAGRGQWRMRCVTLVLAPMFRVIDSIAEDDFYLLAIAVDESLRGEGLGSTLLDRVEAEARASGSRRIALDVSAGNQGARRFYERHGFTVEARWPKRLPLPPLTLYRMIKRLD